jgi:hypothetical protein
MILVQDESFDSMLASKAMAEAMMMDMQQQAVVMS